MAEELSSRSIVESWAPGFIGLMLSVCIYGSGLGQSLFYFYHFPDDHIQIKLAVMITIALDTIHVCGCVQLYWAILIACRHDLSSECWTKLPVVSELTVFANYIIIFIVQCFYAQRVWIISGRHKLITSLVVIIAVADLTIGLACAIFTFQRPTLEYVFSTPLVAYSSALSTACDVIIFSSIVYFLRTGRSELILRRAEHVQQLKRVSVICGLLTCIMSLMTVLLYAFQGNNYWVEITGVILTRLYINSMLSMLNARKSIRDRERDRRDRTIEIPSLEIISSVRPQ